jgi:penicillin amidase
VATAYLLACLFAGCGDQTNPSLTIDPSGTVQVSAPTEFTATLANTTQEQSVTWTITGGGALSNTNGFQVTYSPPPGTNMATLTATAGDLTAEVTIMSAPALLTGEVIPGLTGPVTVDYDAQDIPHIQCAAAADCVAVQGFIQARDRLFQMDLFRHIGKSSLAELIGPAGLSQDVQLRTLFVTRDGQRLETALAATLDAQTKTLVQAYADGVNAYLAQLRMGGKLPAEYDQLPYPLTPADIADWTVEDSEAIGRLQQFELSETLSQESAFGRFATVYGPGSPLQDLGKLNAWIRAAAPTTEQAHTLAPQPFSYTGPVAATRPPTIDLQPWRGVINATAATAHARLRPFGTVVGSNNWVVAGAKSGTGNAMVANDPHLQLQFPPLFHLSVMTSSNAADNLDLAGGTFPGIPGALVGRGAHVGWGVTVVGYDVTDLYLEQFLPQTSCPSPAPCVLFNSAPVSTIPVPQVFNVRLGPGAAGLVDARTHGFPVPAAVVVVPHHGPIIQAPDAAGKAVSVRWTGHEGNTQDLKAFLGLNTATDVDAAIAALKNYATGAQNFVLADDQGHIAYDPHALVPVRRFADARIVGPTNVIPPWFPLPGGGTAEWGDGTSNCAATAAPVPATCWIADDELPQGKDPAKGYFFTANADPTFPSVSDDNNPLAHPPYLSFDWDDSSGFRATRIDQLLAAAIAAHGNVTLDDMQAIQADHMSRPGKVFTDIIATIQVGASTPPEVATAQAIFAQWATDGWDCPSGLLGTDPANSPVDPDPTVSHNSSACYLFHEFARVLATNVFADDLAIAGQDVDGLQAIKAMIFMLQPGLPPAATTFCNTVTAKGVTPHTCMEQVTIALVTAVDTLSAQVGPMPSDWVWGRVHTITPVSQVSPLVSTNFSPGPYARPGGMFTVDVGSPSLSGGSGDFQYFAGGNVRHISVMDPAKPVVKMQLPGPERDNPALFVGPDLLGQWVKNQYFDFAFGDQIKSAAVATQQFTAQ